MNLQEQRSILHRQISKIANELGGALKAEDFQTCLFTIIFYRYLCESFSLYIQDENNISDYTTVSSDFFTADIETNTLRVKGYFIYPRQLFVNFAKDIDSTEDIFTALTNIFSDIQGSAIGCASYHLFKDIFKDLGDIGHRVRLTTKDIDRCIKIILKGVAGIDFGGNFHNQDNKIDLLGDAYEFMTTRALGNSSGEFFTPQCVSELVFKLASHNLTTIDGIYDPACGSGSLLLQGLRIFGSKVISRGFYGQEINPSTCRLACMNMLINNCDYTNFDIELGDTLTNPYFINEESFDVVVSNPPYSVRWDGSSNPDLINDDRFSPAGVLTPKSKADFAFILHALYYLSNKGRAAIVCFPGIFYRSGAEQKNRKYLIDNNYVESIIALAPNLFFNTTVAVNILILSKHKQNTDVHFIDATHLFKKEAKNNTLTDEHISAIIKIFGDKKNIKHCAQLVPYKDIATNDYNLSVSSYVEAKDDREVIDIDKLEDEIRAMIIRRAQLEAAADAIAEEIRGIINSKSPELATKIAEVVK